MKLCELSGATLQTAMFLSLDYLYVPAKDIGILALLHQATGR